MEATAQVGRGRRGPESRAATEGDRAAVEGYRLYDGSSKERGHHEGSHKRWEPKYGFWKTEIESHQIKRDDK